MDTLKTSVLVVVFILLVGCKIEITVPTGGDVESLSQTYSCASGETCVVEVNDFYFSEHFKAEPWPGWVFLGWKSGWKQVCGSVRNNCHLNTIGIEESDALSTIVGSDAIFYLEPVFVRGTPIDEALANVQDESLRACLNWVPPPRRYAEQVRNVDCNEYRYRTGSVQGIEAFSRIERLALRGNGSLTDLQPLGKLSRLQNLDIRLESSYFNAAALGELKLLDYLFLWLDAPNPDLTEMGNLQSLRELLLVNLNSSSVDLNGIGSLVNLRKLLLEITQVSDIGPLAGLTNLEYLSLGSLIPNQISDISPLAGMTKLESLSLRSDQFSDIGPLAGLTNLEYLNLSSNQISDISPLAEMTKLEHLFLSSNQISDISPLAGMTKLESLSLNSNQISDIGPLAEIDSIPQLWLSGNLIQDVSPLKEHYPLTLDPGFYVRLELSENPITSTGDALDGIRTGTVGLIEVPLSCQEYSQLAERYASRWILTDYGQLFYGYEGYSPPERCRDS